MATPANNKAQALWYDLSDWLAIATGDLEPPATRQRISSEIESHYHESIAAHLATGETEAASRALSLLELGDPKDAARNFAKTYLTAQDLNGFARISKIAWSCWSCSLLALCSGFFLQTHDGLLHPSALAVARGALTLCYFAFALMPRLAPNGKPSALSPKQIVIVCVVFENLAYPLWFFFFQAGQKLGLALLCICGAFSAFNILRAWKKLRKLDDTQPKRAA